MKKSAVIKDATRRWKVCVNGPEATCQLTDPDVPRAWCDACVARALLELLLTDDERLAGVPTEVNPRLVAAWERRRARALVGPVSAKEE